MQDTQTSSYSQTDQEYYSMAKSLYQLISLELEKAETRTELSSLYPKLVICAEFFRYIRGEFFTDFRPRTEYQKELYAMQDDIETKVYAIRQKLDMNDAQVKYKLEEAKKNFD